MSIDVAAQAVFCLSQYSTPPIVGEDPLQMDALSLSMGSPPTTCLGSVENWSLHRLQ